MSGFSAIGLVRPKTNLNIGGAMRAAYIYGAAMIAIEGDRARKVSDCEDTTKAWRSIPVLRMDDIFAACPFDAVPIGVDLVEGAKPLPSFKHPKRAFYIFGPEDGTLGPEHLQRCAHVVMIPTRYSMNLAATVNVVLYDRMTKATPLVLSNADDTSES